MKFRPCIDLHDGQVKQIVGSTLRDHINKKDNNDDSSKEQQQQEHQQQELPSSSSSSSSEVVVLATNFSTTRPAADYARMYQKDGLTGGHVIMLGPGNTHAAKEALAAYPGGLQVGGGITDANAQEWLEAGASHVIVTSHVFANGQIHWPRLHQLVDLVGKERLVLDLSCRRCRRGKKRKPTQEEQEQEEGDVVNVVVDDDDDLYYVVTDRWQTFTNVAVTADTLQELSQWCDEFLVHGVDVEGKQCGILSDLVELLGEASPIPVTYAGGVRSMEDMELVYELGKGRVDCTIGSALDCFGGSLAYDDVVAWHHKQQQQQQEHVRGEEEEEEVGEGGK